jgi:hypothetical protein
MLLRTHDSLHPQQFRLRLLDLEAHSGTRADLEGVKVGHVSLNFIQIYYT